VIFQYKQRKEMSEHTARKAVGAGESRGFIGRLVEKLDAAMKRKAEAKAEQGCCCCQEAADDDEGGKEGKGSRCC
jgi:hypothetical protein